MKKNSSQNGRKHGMRSKSPSGDSRLTTTLTYEARARAYHWTTDRSRARLVIKH